MSGVVAFAMRQVGLNRVSMIFLAGVLFAAGERGTRSAIIAACLAFFLYDYLWVAPTYTFRIETAEEAITLGIFLLVAVVTGYYSGELREQKVRAVTRSRMLTSLVQSGGFLSLAGDKASILKRLAESAVEIAGTGALVVDNAQQEIRAGSATAWRGDLNKALLALGAHALEKKSKSTLADGSFCARAITHDPETFGFIVWQPPEGSQKFVRETEDYLLILAELAGAALARATHPSV